MGKQSATSLLKRLKLGNAGDNLSVDISLNMISDWAQTLRDCCILSKWIQCDVMPVFELHPEASFDFCGFLMLQEGYYSFKKKGQLVSRLCDMNAMVLNCNDMLWTLGLLVALLLGSCLNHLSKPCITVL